MGKKEVINHDHERLWEELTLDRVTKPGESPPYGGYGGSHHRWGGYSHSVGGFDVIYYNKEGHMHRIYGPAYVSKRHKMEKWYKEGELHRIGGPAVTHKDTKLWYCDGKLHNMEGPAVIEGGGPKQYWIHGHRISPKEFKKEVERRKNKK
jgi:hypothetical protein